MCLRLQAMPLKIYCNTRNRIYHPQCCQDHGCTHSSWRCPSYPLVHVWHQGWRQLTAKGYSILDKLLFYSVISSYRTTWLRGKIKKTRTVTESWRIRFGLFRLVAGHACGFTSYNAVYGGCHRSFVYLKCCRDFRSVSEV